MLVLAVEGQQARAERPQVARRGRAAGDEGAGAARGAHPAAEDNLAGVVAQPLGELGELGVVEQSVRELEDALHPRLPGARADDLRPRTAAHQQVQRVGQHRLTGPGLAGDRVQALAEAQLGALDQQEVLDPELEEHRARL
jgi:hypothetical protein